MYNNYPMFLDCPNCGRCHDEVKCPECGYEDPARDQAEEAARTMQESNSSAVPE